MTHLTTSDLHPTGASVVAGAPVRGEGTPFVAAGPRGAAAWAATPLAEPPTYRALTTAQLDRVLTAAAAARRAPVQVDRMAVALDATADAMDRHAEVLVATADAETALGRTRLQGELARTTGQLRMMAEEARTGSRRDVVRDPAGEGPAAPALHRTTVPLGVVAVFAASNFPLAFGVAGTDTAAALAAGCPVVAKAHPAQPATAELCGLLLAEGIAAADVDPGFVAVVHDDGHAVGQALAVHDDVDAIAFTGSQQGGRALLDLAARRSRPIPVYAEMGSLNPLFVSEGAAAARPWDLVEGIVGSFLLGEGQFCTKPGLVVLPDGRAGGLVLDGLVDAVRTRPAVHPLLHEGITTAFTEGVVRADQLEGVVAITGPDGGDGSAPALIQASADALLANALLREELFGPATIVVQATDARAGDIADALQPALTASLHFEPSEASWARSLADLLGRKVGRVIANGYPTGVRVSPAQHHGGPYPATSSPLHTSVGLAAIDRFRRPVAFQSFEDAALPGWA